MTIRLGSTFLALASATCFASASLSAGEETEEIVSEFGRLSVSVHGATATSWCPAALCGKEAFFMPEQRPWGGEVHGGLPLCWPWFGRRQGLPIHGLARYMKWRFAGRTADGGLKFEAQSTLDTKRLWPHDFRLWAGLLLAGRDELCVSFTETNTGDKTFESSFGVHPYFSVADACSVDVDGKALPRPNGATLKLEASGGRPPVLHDPLCGRTCEVSFCGCDAWWAWNPGVERTPDCRTLGPDDWRFFYCLEPLCRKPRPLAPGESRTYIVVLRTSCKGL